MRVSPVPHTVANQPVFSSWTGRTNKLFLTLICAWLTLISIAAPVFGAEIETIRLIAFNYPPFFMEENDAVHGLAVDLGDEVFRRLGVRTEVAMYPLKRGLSNLESGIYDGVMILIKTSERGRFLEYTRPVMTVRGLIWALATRGKPVTFDSLEDLQKYKIGVTKGYSYGEEFDQLLKQMNPDVAYSDYHNYRKLMEHRIDIFPGNEIVARSLFKQHPELRGRFIHSDKSFIEWVLHMAISKKSRFATMIPDINRVLAELEAEGYVDALVEQYTGSGPAMVAPTGLAQ